MNLIGGVLEEENGRAFVRVTRKADREVRLFDGRVVSENAHAEAAV